MEALGLLFGVSVASLTLMLVVLSVAAPVLWLWMLIDSVVREEWEYPGATATSNNRLLWVLLILLTQIAAIPYFFMVYAKIRRGSVAAPTARPQAQEHMAA
jgi:archaellum biogenesis protein FlaJ (TadC family)